MLFNSIEFLYFFPIVIIAYYVVGFKYRWILLLCASYFFYGAFKIEFLSLIILSTLVDFFIAKKIYITTNQNSKLKLLLISLICNLGLLIFFKYSAFFANFILPLLPITTSKEAQILELLTFDLPVGISFYTFQTMAYSIDVYKNRIQPEKHLGKFALYVSYFPQLVAGPIERFSHLQPQLLSNQIFNYKNLSAGFKLMLYGFFIKMVIADNIASVVEPVYEQPLNFTSLSRWLSLMGFGWQVYADFYGYSLIAIGAAKCMGVKLIDNFKTPFFAISIQDFWRRWHISLSTWFRDYVFVPLGGSRVNQLIWARNILIVFTLSGLWHGANYTFILFGVYHGLFYLTERFVKTPYLSKFRFLGWLKTTFFLTIGWTFFRSPNLTNAFDMLVGKTNPSKYYSAHIPTYLIVAFLIFLFFEFYFKKHGVSKTLQRLPFALKWAVYGILLFFIIAFAGTTNHPFIYFQF